MFQHNTLFSKKAQYLGCELPAYRLQLPLPDASPQVHETDGVLSQMCQGLTQPRFVMSNLWMPDVKL
jgi:hypothetical protein